MPYPPWRTRPPLPWRTCAPSPHAATTNHWMYQSSPSPCTQRRRWDPSLPPSWVLVTWGGANRALPVTGALFVSVSVSLQPHTHPRAYVCPIERCVVKQGHQGAEWCWCLTEGQTPRNVCLSFNIRCFQTSINCCTSKPRPLP